MSDNFDAIYQAVRSRIPHVDIGAAVENVLRESNLSFYAERVANVGIEAALETMRPSVLYRPKLSIDGNQWCALYGDNIQDGVAGFGDSPAKAMQAFDAAWAESLSPRAGGLLP